MKNFNVRIASFTLTFVMILGVTVAPRDAGSTGWPVLDISNFIQNTLSAIVDVDIQLKEFVLDGLAKSVANAVATQMKNNIVTWINSGFEGNPAFITDLEGFLLDIGDTVAADFIQTLDSETQSLICSPWRTDIKYSLTISYYSSTSGRPTDRCSLDEIFANAERLDKFLDGSFSDGGWTGWFKLTTKPHNNPYGSYLQVQDELNAKILGKTVREKDSLGWSSGFLSKKVCDDEVFTYVRDSGLSAGDYDVVEEGADAGCIVVTPGQSINSSLSDVLGSDLRDLELADEFNEIVSALVTQLAKEVITGPNGLLGTSRPQAGSRESFLDRVGATQQQQSQTATTATAEQRLQQAIGNENQFKDIQTDSLQRITALDAALRPLEACLATKSILDPQFTASFTFASTTRAFITTSTATINSAITTSNSALTTLTQLQGDIGTAQNTAALQAILTTLQNLEASNTVHNGQDVVAATRSSTEIVRRTESATTETGTRLSSCIQ